MFRVWARGATVLAALLFACAAPAAGAADWLVLGDSPANATFAIDLDSVERVAGRRVAVWLKRVPAQPESRGLFKGSLAQSQERYLIDCSARSSGMIADLAFDQEGKLLESREYRNPPETMRAIAPGTMIEKAGAMACAPIRVKGANRAQVNPDKLLTAKWREVTTDKEGSTYAVAEDQIWQGEGNYRNMVTFLSRYVHRTPQPLGALRFTTLLILQIGDCRQKLVGQVSASWFDRRDMQIYREDTEPSKWRTDPPPRLSVSEAMLDSACEIAAAQRTARGEPPIETAALPASPQAPPAPAPRERGEGEGSRDGAERKGGSERQGEAPMSGSGTGWHVGNGLIVTAAHVVDGADSIRVIGPGERLVSANVVQSDAKNDIAVISIGSSLGMKSIALAGRPAALGSRVMTIGFPLLTALGSAPKVTSGEISATQGMDNDPTVYQISAPVQAGNSGGPLFNMNGEVVGMVVSKLRAEYILKTTGDLPQNVNYAVKTRYIEALLEEANRGPLPPALAVRKELRAEELVSQNRDAVLIILVSKQAKK